MHAPPAMAEQAEPDSRNDYLVRLLAEVQAQFLDCLLPEDLQLRFPEIAGIDGNHLEYEVLYKFPGLQESLAFIVHYTPSKWLLEQEAPHIRQLRILHRPEQEVRTFEPHAARRGTSQDDSGDIYQWARDTQISGLCFSGGGIRSATFNLGVLQGLAERGWLSSFDYLSSVSGGGYIHSWLAAWMKRRTLEELQGKGQPTFQKDLGRAFERVRYRLTPLPGRMIGDDYQTVWPRQIQWLRRYSNYLTPQVGLFTGDTWSAVAMWIRNVLLNQTLLISIFLGLLCIPHLLAPAVRFLTEAPKAVPIPAYLLLRSQFLDYWHKDAHATFLHKVETMQWPVGAALACFAGGVLLIIFLLRWEYKLATEEHDLKQMTAAPASAAAGRRHTVTVWLRTSIDEGQRWLRRKQIWIVNAMLGLLLLFSMFWTYDTVNHLPSVAYPIGMFLMMFSLVCAETFAGGALGQAMTRKQTLEGTSFKGVNRAAYATWKIVALTFLGIPAAVTGAVAGVAIAALLRSWRMDHAATWLGLTSPWSLRLVTGTLLYFWLTPFSMVLASGFIGKDFPDWLSEWLGRIRAYTLMIGIGWVGFFGTALLMPGVLVRVHTMSHWVRWPALLTWAATTAGSVLGGKSAKTSGGEDSSAAGRVLEGVVILGPYVYIAGLLSILALVLEELHAPLAGPAWSLMHDLQVWTIAFVVLAGFAVMFGFRLDINEFSMYSFYRDRLTRCYLGASNLTRNPSPVTGFDERDTLHLQIAELTFDRAYPGPIPIFCCAMNITVGEDLAWQERKAASFAFTPYYSGYTVGWTEAHKDLRFNGFVPTEYLYEGDPTHSKAIGGPNIATAMAASGAAVSPNMGYHTNPATAFLMTMFDVRLGLWIPNPRRSPMAGQKLGVPPSSRVLPASPNFAPRWLANELLGSVNDSSKYVYLSDGGHFDNMGLYELVRRRCHRIVICDAEEDGKDTFCGIGDAIRKCRIDFGAEIDLDLSALILNSKTHLSPAHVVRGTVRYPETPARQSGTVLYIKASLTGKLPPGKGDVELPDVPGDIQSYRQQHEHFPHDSTTDQWFTESQFESYRRLGQTIIEGLQKLV